MADEKISQLTPKGSNLSTTDLLEVSVLDGEIYISKSITGEEIMDSASITIDGDSGSASGSTLTLSSRTGNGCGATVSFDGGFSTISFNIVDANGNMTLGSSAGTSSMTGFGNCIFASQSGAFLTDGQYNCGSGYGSFSEAEGASFNSWIGTSALTFLVSGNYNFAGGYSSGQNYTSNESSNALLNHDGVVGDNHTMRLCMTGSGDRQVNRAFMGGVNGVSVSNMVAVTMDSVTEQIGTAPFPTTPAATLITSNFTIPNSTSMPPPRTWILSSGDNNDITITLPDAPFTGETHRFNVVNAPFNTTIASAGAFSISGFLSILSAGIVNSILITGSSDLFVTDNTVNQQVVELTCNGQYWVLYWNIGFSN